MAHLVKHKTSNMKRGFEETFLHSCQMIAKLNVEKTIRIEINYIVLSKDSITFTLQKIACPWSEFDKYSTLPKKINKYSLGFI